MRLLSIYFLIANRLDKYGIIFSVPLVYNMSLFCPPMRYFFIGGSVPYLGAILEFFSFASFRGKL